MCIFWKYTIINFLKKNVVNKDMKGVTVVKTTTLKGDKGEILEVHKVTFGTIQQNKFFRTKFLFREIIFVK